jgi:hypothetical protein
MHAAVLNCLSAEPFMSYLLCVVLDVQVSRCILLLLMLR